VSGPLAGLSIVHLRQYSGLHAGEGSHRPPTRPGVPGSARVDSEGLTIRLVRPSPRSV
jgi:hypothetical protein